MSDEAKQSPNRDRRGCITCLVISFVAMCGLGTAIWYGARLGQDAVELDQMSQAIARFISEKHEWPRSWESLASYYATLPHAREGDASRAYKRIEVNFEIDLRKAPQATDWYVRLRGPGNQGQEGEENYYLRRRIIEFQKDLREPTAPKKRT
jgi:hypothetical protein